MRLIAITLILILSGCGHQSVCRHEALIAAIVEAEHGYHVRIVSGTTADGGKHAQAQRLKGDEWQWLYVDLFWTVKTCDQDNFTPHDYWTVNDYYVSRFWNLMDRMK